MIERTRAFAQIQLSSKRSRNIALRIFARLKHGETLREPTQSRSKECIPCHVLSFSMRSPGSQHVNPRSASTSSASLCRVRLHKNRNAETLRQLARRSLHIALRRYAPLPQSTSASGMLGVITLSQAETAPCKRLRGAIAYRRLPLVDTMTGSTTMFSAACARSDSAIATTFNADDTMPIFGAGGECRRTPHQSVAPNSLGTSARPKPPRVFFCAVSAVTAVGRKQPTPRWFPSS